MVRSRSLKMMQVLKSEPHRGLSRLRLGPVNTRTQRICLNLSVEVVFALLTMPALASGLRSPGICFEENNEGFVARAPSGWIRFPREGAVVEVGATVKIRVAGARGSVAPEGIGPLAGRSNYFLGRQAAAWKTNLRHYDRLLY